MAVTLKIAGVDRTSILCTTNPSFTLPVKGQRGSSNFKLKNEPDASAYAPVEGQQVEWYDDATRVFLGTIDTFKTSAMIETGGGFFYDVAAVSFEQRIDKRTVTRAFPAGMTAGAILSDILSTELAAEGISAGTINDGATFENNQVYDHARVSDVFVALASFTNYVWYIDPATGSLNFTPQTSTPAPFSATDSEVLAVAVSPYFQVTRANYRNRQHVKISESTLLPNREQFVGDGSTSSFTLSKAIREIASITITTAAGASVDGTFSANPVPGDTVTVGGTTYVFTQ